MLKHKWLRVVIFVLVALAIPAWIVGAIATEGWLFPITLGLILLVMLGAVVFFLGRAGLKWVRTGKWPEGNDY